MPKLSLRWNLAIHFTVLTAVTIILVAYTINSSLDRQFSQYLMLIEDQRNATVVQAVEDVYMQTMSWQASGPDLSRLSAMANRWIQVQDPAGHVVFDSASERRGQPMMHGRRIPLVPPDGTPIMEIPIEVNGLVVGQARLGSLTAEQGVFSQEDLLFRRTVNRSIVWAGSAAIILAALFSLVLAQGLSRPLQNLAMAARRMAAGDLNQRVKATGGAEFSFLARAFNDMASNLDQLEQLRRKAAADISHELRTPLTTIRGYVEGMRDGVITLEEKNWDAIESDVQRLSQLVNDLQDLAQAEAPLWDKQLLVLQDGIKHSVQVVERMASAKQLKFSVELPIEPIHVMGQSEKLERVWINLLANAAKYSPVESTIVVGCKLLDQKVQVFVEDQGPGISKDHIPLIFERFYRIDTSRTRVTGGSGIGLTIAKELITAHGGSIAVDATYTAGTRFLVTLPTP